MLLERPLQGPCRLEGCFGILLLKTFSVGDLKSFSCYQNKRLVGANSAGLCLISLHIAKESTQLLHRRPPVVLFGNMRERQD